MSLRAEQSNFSSRWDFDLVNEVIVQLKEPEDASDWTYAPYLMKNKAIFKLIDDGLYTGNMDHVAIKSLTDDQLIAGLNHLLGTEFADYTNDELDLKTEQ